MDSNELVTALDKIVSFYKDDIESYALQVTTQLMDSFERLKVVDPQEDHGASISAAV